MASTAPQVNGTATKTPKLETEYAISATTAVDTQSKPEAENLIATQSVPAAGTASPEKKWPGWPGDCVFRLLVPVLKVGSIIGRKGDLIRKMCEETKARIRVLDAPVGTTDRIVLISGKEEKEAALSPAMDAVIRVFKRINGFQESEGTGASIPFCSIRLLVPSMQAISLIGKQGSQIKSIQENTACSVRVLSSDDVSKVNPNSDDRIVDMQGEGLKVLKALEAVIGHLRKFLIDRSVLPLFEKTNNGAAPQEQQADTRADRTMMYSGSQSGIGGDYPLSTKRETLFLDRQPQQEQQFTSSGLPLYGRDSGLSITRSPAFGRTTGPIITQMSQTMQIPLVYAEDIIGVGGTNIAYIRRSSGAILTVQESRGLPDEITVEIKGTSSQVQTAQMLIQECVNSHKESVPRSYGKIDPDFRSSYSELGSSSYLPSSSSAYGGYGLGGYTSYRM